MTEMCLFILLVAATMIVVVAWLRWLYVGYAPDYDIEAYLGGMWARTGFGGFGKACWTQKVLRGRWRDMTLLIELTFWRRSLLSFGERYLVVATKQNPSPPLALENVPHAFPPTAAPSPLGVWQFARHGTTCALGRAEYRIPACRIVRTPTQIRHALDETLTRLHTFLET